eukprot:2319964-Pleurochrysis_carterae.AAC.3
MQVLRRDSSHFRESAKPRLKRCGVRAKPRQACASCSAAPPPARFPPSRRGSARTREQRANQDSSHQRANSKGKGVPSAVRVAMSAKFFLRVQFPYSSSGGLGRDSARMFSCQSLMLTTLACSSEESSLNDQARAHLVRGEERVHVFDWPQKFVNDALVLAHLGEASDGGAQVVEVADLAPHLLLGLAHPFAHAAQLCARAPVQLRRVLAFPCGRLRAKRALERPCLQRERADVVHRRELHDLLLNLVVLLQLVREVLERRRRGDEELVLARDTAFPQPLVLKESAQVFMHLVQQLQGRTNEKE